MYHLLLLTSTIDDRRAKREWYESLVPGLAVEEFPIEDMYVPEELEAIETESVPEADRALIEAVLTPGTAERGAGDGPRVEEATREQIALYNTDRSVLGRGISGTDRVRLGACRGAAGHAAPLRGPRGEPR